MARKALLILSYRELHDRTVTKLKKGGYDQVPQLEGRTGNFKRLFLSAANV